MLRTVRRAAILRERLSKDFGEAPVIRNMLTYEGELIYGCLRIPMWVGASLRVWLPAH